MWEYPDGMEGWGVVGILKEAARLLHNHFRLFLPSILYFQSGAALGFLLLLRQATVCHRVPRSSFVGVTTFPPSPAEAGLQLQFEEEKYAEYLHSPCHYSQSTLIHIYFGMLLFLIVGSMPLAAYAFVVEHIYSDAGTESNDGPITITKKLLGKLFLRVFVTLFFTCAMVWMIYAVCSTVGILGVVLGIISDPSGNTQPLIFRFKMVPLVIAIVAGTTMFGLSPLIAVLEPENYGLPALKRSLCYVEGRIFSIFCIALLCATTGGLIFASWLAIEYIAEPPVWLVIILFLFLISFYWVASTYFGVMWVVTYFVCKINFDAFLPDARNSRLPVHKSNPLKTMGVP